MQNCPKPKYHLLLYYTNIYIVQMYVVDTYYYTVIVHYHFCFVYYSMYMVWNIFLQATFTWFYKKKTTKKNLIKFVLLWKVHARCFIYMDTNITHMNIWIVLHKRERVFIIWFYGHLEKLCTCVRHGWNFDVTILF